MRRRCFVAGPITTRGRRPGFAVWLRRIPEAVAVTASLCACVPTQSPPTALASETKYVDFRVLSDEEKRTIARGALKGVKDARSARIKWPQFPNSTQSPVVYCALINAKAQVILVTQSAGNILDAALDTTDRGPTDAADFCQRKGINLAEVT
jgi:hypothetical protein